MNKPAVGWPDVDHSRTPLAWSLPTNLMPPVAAGWSPGTRRNASEAERILSTAVAWWDPTVSGFRDGDRWLRNSGTAGGLLDLRLGSSTIPNTNDPKWLVPEDTGYIYLPGVNYNGPTITDTTGSPLDFSGDIDVRVRVAAESSWIGFLLTKWNVSIPFGFWVYGGTPYFRWVDTVTGDTGDLGAGGNYWNTLPRNTPIWLRATLRADNGAGKAELKFFHSYDASTWTQAGTTITRTTTASRIINNDMVTLGGYGNGSTQDFAGKFYQAQIWNGIEENGGTKVLDVDCDAITSGSATSFTATTGQTCTINRSTSGRKSVAVPARRLGGRACFLFGTDDYMEVVDNWQHQLLNFGQGDSFTAMIVLRPWGNSVGNNFYMAKRSNTTGLGWDITSTNGTIRPTVTIQSANGVFTQVGGSTVTSGAFSLFGTSKDVQRGLSAITNSTVSSASSVRNVLDISNLFPMRIGRSSDGTAQYTDFEFRAAAIFRRAVTAREISVLSTYYSGG